MFRQDRTNPSTAVSSWKGRHDTSKAWPSTLVSSWLNGGLFGGAGGGAGYVAGAYTTGLQIDKFAFPTDVRDTLSATLTVAHSGGAGHSNSGVAGYVAAGLGTGGSTAITAQDQLLYATDSISVTTICSSTNGAPYFCAGASNSGVAGYVTNGAPDYTETVKFNYPTMTLSGILNVFPSPGPYIISACSNEPTAYYVMGGNVYSGGWSTIDTVQKLTYASDTAAAITATLGATRNSTTGMSDVGVAGYAAGGHVTSYSADLDTCDKLAYATESISYTTVLTADRAEMAGFANSGTAGYFAGGNGAVHKSTVIKYTFPSDTVADLGTGLSVAARAAQGFANESSLA